MTITHFTKKVEFVPNLKKKLEEKITEDIERALKFELERFEFQELLKKYELKASAEIYGLDVIYLYFIDKDGYRFDALDKFRNYFKILILPRIYEENGKYIIENYIKVLNWVKNNQIDENKNKIYIYGKQFAEIFPLLSF